ncbi:hypothetical protein ACGFS9_07015 [Streptomyces sp. NPDC048566]|uniref:hypothetical protein n=1 Tax=Streptomyces sp. NPDC048566 TaxID=3365569 RepID=UPI0037173B5C
MGGAGRGRRAVLALGATALLGACTPTKKSDDGPRVRTDPEPLHRRFPQLGPLSDAHWLGTPLGGDSRVSAPGPTDVRVVGTARMRAGSAAAITGVPERRFRRASVDRCPDDIVEFLPEGARWVRITSFDEEVTASAYSGAFSFDPDTDTVYFDTVDPRVATGPGPSSTGPGS